MRVAVVRNRENQGVIARFGRPSPEVYGRQSVQRVIDALRAVGHTPEAFEGDMTMLPALREFLPPDPATQRPSGLVFNMAYGVQGDCRYTHVPAMLEMAGLPYTGSSPLGHTLALDKVVTKILMLDAGVPTPRYEVRGLSSSPTALRFPLVVKPRHESSSFGLRLCRTPGELDDAVASIVQTYAQDALVEEYIHGREVAVGILGNEPGVCLPLVEMDFSGHAVAMMTHTDKVRAGDADPMRICPAPVDSNLAGRLRDLALRTFHACHCRDYARVDIRIDERGEPWVLEINSMASLGWNGSYVLAARQAGYSFPELVGAIVDAAHARTLGGPAPRGDASSTAGVAGSAVVV